MSGIIESFAHDASQVTLRFQPRNNISIKPAIEIVMGAPSEDEGEFGRRRRLLYVPKAIPEYANGQRREISLRLVEQVVAELRAVRPDILIHTALLDGEVDQHKLANVCAGIELRRDQYPVFRILERIGNID